MPKVLIVSFTSCRLQGKRKYGASSFPTPELRTGRSLHLQASCRPPARIENADALLRTRQIEPSLRLPEHSRQRRHAIVTNLAIEQLIQPDPSQVRQRVRRPPGKGGARQSEASLGWATATSLLKRRQRAPKSCLSAQLRLSAYIRLMFQAMVTRLHSPRTQSSPRSRN